VYRSLDPERIVETADLLALRVSERFPGYGIARVTAEIAETARQARARCVEIGRPHRGLRISIALLYGLGLVAIAVLVLNLEFTPEMWRVENFFAELNDLLGTAVFLGAAILFLSSLEGRRKRRRALDAVAELRALAHVVDMHQLTKDPEPILLRGPGTPHSPKRSMTPFELGRYFDYCSEGLSVIAKISALYAAALQDPVALEAADDLEALCTGLSRKIWQKISLLDRYAAPPE
jgi:hypothetical protein